MRIFLLALVLAALSGCERYEKVGESDGQMILKDRYTGELYMIWSDGSMRKVQVWQVWQ